MYYQYFGLNEAPFSIAVNPRYLFMSPRHRDALAHLLYGVGAGGGFILLTGEVGTGKTTINRCLLEQLPSDTDVAIILNPALNAMELLASVCDELGVPYDPDKHTLKTLTDELHKFLMENHTRGRKTVLLIDEAQHLDFDVLEQIRLLTNLETNNEKLLQIILIGQPELAEMLARPELRQLNQRITARYNLEPLNLDETGAYIHHRLQVAGMSPERVIFAPSVVRGIHKVTRGIPRLINTLCDRMLLGAYGLNKSRADHAMLKLAAREVLGEPYTVTPTWTWAAVAGAVAVLVWAGGWMLGNYTVTPEAVEPPRVQLEPREMPQINPEHAAPDVVAPNTVEQAIAQPSVVMSEPSTVPAPSESVALESSQVKSAVVESAPSGELASIVAPAPEERPEKVDIASIMLPPGESLARLWGAYSDEPVSPVPCSIEVQAGLACFEGEAWTWDELSVIDRPLSLEAITPERFSADILLLGMADSRAWVLTTQGVAQVSLAELAPHWTGRYRFLWRVPEGFENALTLGQESDVVASVARWFAQLDGQPEPLAGRQFNRVLQERVRLFQRQQGLADDGVVGLQTLLALNAQLGIDITAAQARQWFQGSIAEGAGQ